MIDSHLLGGAVIDTCIQCKKSVLLYVIDKIMASPTGLLFGNIQNE